MAKRPRSRPPAPRPADEDGDIALLHPLAVQVRHAYIVRYRIYWQARHGVPSSFGARPMPRWDGGRAADGKLYKPIWYKIARVAYDLQIDPDDLVEAAFHGWDHNDPPWPTNLLAAETVRRAQAHPGITAESLRRALEVQRDLWRVETGMYARARNVDREVAASRVLRDRTLELSSIFRYCMASLVGDEPVIREFEPGALQQYAYNRRAYDTGWEGIIPARLGALADRIGGGEADHV